MMLIVGVALIDSLKVVVMVTTLDPETKLSKSESMMLDKVGGMLSKRNVVVVAVFKFPAKSSIEFSFKVRVTVPEKDKVFVAVIFPEKEI